MLKNIMIKMCTLMCIQEKYFITLLDWWVWLYFQNIQMV